MRTALCISGQMRTYKRCYESQKENLIDVLDPDTFIHTWRKIGKSTRKEENVPEQENKVQSKQLKEFYNAEKVVIEEFKNEYFDEYKGVSVPDILKEKEPEHYKGSIPMFYKIYACNELKKRVEEEKSFKYDLVIRIRPDLAIYENPDYFSNLTKLWFSGNLLDPSFQVSDKFAFGNSKVMDYYSSVWKKLNDYWKNPLGKEKSNTKTNRVGERLLKTHMEASEYESESFHIETDLIRF